MDLLHPNGQCECHLEGWCSWCVRTNTRGERLALVCGSRSGHVTIADAWWLKGVLEGIGATGVIHGDCRHTGCGQPKCFRPSIDQWAGEIAVRCGMKNFPVPAQWERYQNAAGPLRNRIMLEAPVELVVAFPSSGPGTRGMCELAVSRGLRVLRRSS